MDIMQVFDGSLARDMEQMLLHGGSARHRRTRTDTALGLELVAAHRGVERVLLEVRHAHGELRLGDLVLRHVAHEERSVLQGGLGPTSRDIVHVGREGLGPLGVVGEAALVVVGRSGG